MNAVWSKADIHVHTTASDGHSSACEVLEAAREAGLAIVAITDHDTIDGALEARSYAERYGVEVIVGEEVSTSDGHLLALWIERRIAPGRPLAETIAEIHAQGGLAIIAHPFDWLVSSVGDWLPAQHSGAWPLDGVEVFNASLPLPGMNRRAAEATLIAGIAALGGSDSHHATTVGTGYTRFAGRTGNISARQSWSGKPALMGRVGGRAPHWPISRAACGATSRPPCAHASHHPRPKDDGR